MPGIKGNTDVELANRLSMGIYNKLSYTNAIIRDNRSVLLVDFNNINVRQEVLKNTVGLTSLPLPVTFPSRARKLCEGLTTLPRKKTMLTKPFQTCTPIALTGLEVYMIKQELLELMLSLLRI